ncbi:MAG: response regulator transcription factor, partial [Promethearchaeota archaeon]
MNNEKMKILLVEDDINLGTILKDFLSVKDYTVTHCMDGKEGLQKYGELKLDLIILDVMMPRLDGFSLAIQIRKTDKSTPIIFLTAKSMLDDKLKGLKLGGDDYITKPFSSEELFLRIENIFKRVATSKPISESNEIFEIGSFKFNYVNRQLSNGNSKHKLTSK